MKAAFLSISAASAFLIVGAGLVACTVIVPQPETSQGDACVFTADTALTAYRLPDEASTVFGTVSAGETYEALARTAEGWVGFDPGIAQGANIGLARHRWVLLDDTNSPDCLGSVESVTLEDVQIDLEASQQ